jgi:hypothetical protein
MYFLLISFIFDNTIFCLYIKKKKKAQPFLFLYRTGDSLVFFFLLKTIQVL